MASRKMARYAVTHASTPGGNPRRFLMGWFVRGKVEPSFATYGEALEAAAGVSRAHDGAPATVVTADRKLETVYGPFRPAFGELTSEPQDGTRTVRKLVNDNRGDPSDPHSPICYAALGADLESNCSAGELARFAGDMWQSTDGAMRSLATYARFLSHARRHRLAGDISAAIINEAAADTVCERDILPENRW